MKRRRVIGRFIGTWMVASFIAAFFLKKNALKTTYIAEQMEPITKREMGFYEKYIKRVLDILCGSAAITFLSPLYFFVAVLVKLNLGSPVLFTQDRPGLIVDDGKERIFKMYKFRTMTNATDSSGKMLSDEQRLTNLGKLLRKTSLDELPEAINIMNGSMSVIGPRPQLVRDLVFMSKEQRMRHSAKPGLSGLAQVNGRNEISWDEKLNLDLSYITNISFIKDLLIVAKTVKSAIIKTEGVTQQGMATAEDYGDYLLANNMISVEEYELNNEKAKHIKKLEDKNYYQDELVSIIMPSYNTELYIRQSIQSVLDQTYHNWELIIVDDCSNDGTINVIKSINDGRIHLIQNNNNVGAAECRNIAIRNARGRWIAFLDSDDIWMSEKLEKQIHFMRQNEYAFSYTNYEQMDENGDSLGSIVTGPKRITKTGMFNYCWPGCLTVMYDASRIGLVQIRSIRKNNDYAMWLKICRKENCYLLDECLAKYRKGRSGSVSTESAKTMIKWHYKLFREAEHQNMVVSIINTCRNMVFGIYKKIRYVS